MALKLRISSFSRAIAFCHSGNTCSMKKYAYMAIASRPFHSGRPLLASSPLLNLSGLSTSREAQHLSKEYRIPRTEFSPHLELIRSSEVLPFASTASTTVQGDQAATSTGAPHEQERVRWSRDRSGSSMSSSAKTVTATMKHLIDELASTRSKLQGVALEKALLDSEVRRKNREVLSLSLLSTALVLALLFPDERAALFQWAVGSKKILWTASTKNPPAKNYMSEQEEMDFPWFHRRDATLDQTATAPHPPSNLSQGLPHLLQLTASEEGKRSEKSPSSLSGYFWSSTSSR